MKLFLFETKVRKLIIAKSTKRIAILNCIYVIQRCQLKRIKIRYIAYFTIFDPNKHKDLPIKFIKYQKPFPKNSCQKDAFCVLLFVLFRPCPEGGGGGGRGGVDLITLLAFLSSVISSFFTQNKGGPRSPGLLP